MIICEYGNTELTETHRGSVLVKSYQDSGTHSLKHANMRNSSLRADLEEETRRAQRALGVEYRSRVRVRGTDKAKFNQVMNGKWDGEKVWQQLT